MSLKSEADEPKTPGGNSASGAGRPRWGLASQLTIWYSSATFLLLLLATSFLYFTLVDYLEREDDQHLDVKLREVEGVLWRVPLNVAKLEQAVGMDSLVARGRDLEPFLIRVKSGDDQTLIAETPGMRELLPLGAFNRAREIYGPLDRPYPLQSPSGRAFRGLTKRVTAPDGSSYLIHGAADHEPEVRILAQYRQKLWWVHSIGLVLSVVVGQFLARRGLRPLATMAQSVRNVRATTLDQRIATEGMPAELATLADSFNHMLQGLEDAFDRLSRYSADIAHELRTPINNLRGEAEVALSRARSPSEYREVLGSCLEECQRLSSLISSLLFIARAENPANQIQLENVSIAHEFASMDEFYSVLASDAEMSLEFDAPEMLAARLDRHLFQRAVGNLIENALKYSSKGGRIGVRAISEGDALRVEVADQGQGVPPEHLPHIFGRFYRVDANRSKETGGLGLGLAIVRTIATLHGGRAEMSSTLGQGTTVTLLFPHSLVAPQPQVQ